MVESSHRLRAWLDAVDATIASCAARLATDGSCEEPAAFFGTVAAARAVKPTQWRVVARSAICCPMATLSSSVVRAS